MMPPHRLLWCRLRRLVQPLPPVPEHGELLEQRSVAGPARWQPHPAAVRLLQTADPLRQVLQLRAPILCGKLPPVPGRRRFIHGCSPPRPRGTRAVFLTTRTRGARSHLPIALAAVAAERLLPGSLTRTSVGSWLWYSSIAR